MTYSPHFLSNPMSSLGVITLGAMPDAGRFPKLETTILSETISALPLNSIHWIVKNDEGDFQIKNRGDNSINPSSVIASISVLNVQGDLLLIDGRPSSNGTYLAEQRLFGTSIFPEKTALRLLPDLSIVLPDSEAPSLISKDDNASSIESKLFALEEGENLKIGRVLKPLQEGKYKLLHLLWI